MPQIQTYLGNTLDSARRIRFQPSTFALATNVQDAITNIANGAMPGLITPTVVTASGALTIANVVVQTNQSGAIALTLPTSASWVAQNSKNGVPLSIFDISGTASTNNVTITPNGAETISGLANLTISTDYGGYRLEPKSGGGWVVV